MLFSDRFASEMTYIVSGGALNSTQSLILTVVCSIRCVCRCV